MRPITLIFIVSISGLILLSLMAYLLVLSDVENKKPPKHWWKNKNK